MVFPPSYAAINDLNTAIRLGATVLYASPACTAKVLYAARGKHHAWYICMLADGREVEFPHSSLETWAALMAQLPS